jgi:hypothetical protein
VKHSRRIASPASSLVVPTTTATRDNLEGDNRKGLSLRRDMGALRVFA